ncbi:MULTISPECIES: hypothetical protein [unclassified Corynebacterium]|uniref:hypothetical protein n=1 Tax=unclassified Corynebacterium TaxID=2624378 RepID=UPI0029CA24B3|nr:MULTISPECIES: hypothetical protein [unclassified Corynebacterium]WPF66595.1 hypothetical protein OLX12_02360 [Corynebacterium sp. 22KM0430]WPF69083.1 hypothetical protein OLW90_02355 [Corynebacterium sp. 21KM1197]
MGLLRGPIWEMRDTGSADTDSTFIRIRLCGDVAVAEFFLTELCSFFGIDGLDCLQRQFRVWYEEECFSWDPVEKIHVEQRPFSHYFPSTRVPGCYAPQPLPEAIDGKIMWGMAKE